MGAAAEAAKVQPATVRGPGESLVCVFIVELLSLPRFFALAGSTWSLNVTRVIARDEVLERPAQG
eukprot:13089446-Alexandrium_andersonii.AAC.1